MDEVPDAIDAATALDRDVKWRGQREAIEPMKGGGGGTRDPGRWANAVEEGA